MPSSQPYMRSISLVGLEEFLNLYGVRLSKLMEELGLEPELLRSSDLFYPYQKHVDLWERAAERAGEPHLGLDYATYLSPHFVTLGPIMMMAKFHKNTKELLQSTMRYLRHHTTGLEVSYSVSKDGKWVSGRSFTHPSINPGRQVAEADLAIIFQLVNHFAGKENAALASVSMNYAKPDTYKTLENYFQCSIEFNQSFCGHLYSSPALNQPIGSNLRFLKPVFDKVANYALSYDVLPETSFVQTVSMAISMHLGTGRCNLESIAGSLQMHPKKLQRELSKDGISFSALFDDVRRSLAYRLLKETKMPIADLAAYLEYTNSSSFSLAFKRWENQTPGRYRNQNSHI